jgi:hypothetical protein
VTVLVEVQITARVDVLVQMDHHPRTLAMDCSHVHELTWMELRTFGALPHRCGELFEW